MDRESVMAAFGISEEEMVAIEEVEAPAREALRAEEEAFEKNLEAMRAFVEAQLQRRMNCVKQ